MLRPSEGRAGEVWRTSNQVILFLLYVLLVTVQNRMVTSGYSSRSVTRLWTGILTNWGSNPGTINVFFSVLRLSDRFRTHTVHCPTVPGSLALGEGKCPSCEHRYSPITTAKVKNEWSYTFTPHSLHGEVLNKHKKIDFVPLY